LRIGERGESWEVAPGRVMISRILEIALPSAGIYSA